jgi:hypothetical protein
LGEQVEKDQDELVDMVNRLSFGEDGNDEVLEEGWMRMLEEGRAQV